MLQTMYTANASSPPITSINDVSSQLMKNNKPRSYRSLSMSRWRSALPLSLLIVQVLLGLTIITTTFAENSNIAAGDNEGDVGIDLSDANFDGMSLMPVACINYMNKDMIKFEMFNKEYNFQCHSNSVGTYLVSISHYMRVHFNYQSLIKGEDFTLPSDVGYLNCVQIDQVTDSGQNLYARIGCLERKAYSSTKLSIHLYTDKQCSQYFDDGQTNEERMANGYIIDDTSFQTQVSFGPSFYSCENCQPPSIADGFSKENTVWYDDDTAAKYKYFDDWMDDTYKNDDNYGAVQNYVNNEVVYEKEDDDNFYTMDDDDDNDRRRLSVREELKPVEDEFEKFEKDWIEQRELYNDDAIDDSIKNWEMCSTLYKYSMWCDNDCRNTGNFRIDEWSLIDLFLLGVMGVFLISTMSLILSNRRASFHKASLYADDFNAPSVGIPPQAMGYLFLMILLSIGIMASLRLVNLTMVVTVMLCVVLFVWLLKVICFSRKKCVREHGDSTKEYFGKDSTPYSLT